MAGLETGAPPVRYYLMRNYRSNGRFFIARSIFTPVPFLLIIGIEQFISHSFMLQHAGEVLRFAATQRFEEHLINVRHWN